MYYQSTSKEYIEFLRDENTTNLLGQELYDLWSNNSKYPLELMSYQQLSLSRLASDFDGDFRVDTADFVTFVSYWMADGCLGSATCGGMDFDGSSRVGLADFAIFAQDWPWGVTGWRSSR